MLLLLLCTILCSGADAAATSLHITQEASPEEVKWLPEHHLFRRWSQVEDYLVSNPSRRGARGAHTPPSIQKRDEVLHEILRTSHPIANTDELKVEDFLWTGSGDYETEDYEDEAPGLLNTNQLHTFPTAQPHVDGDPRDASTGSSPPGSSSHPLGNRDGLGEELPEDEFLIRTILVSNMTIIHNGIETFKSEMEGKLTQAYREAYIKMHQKRVRRASGEEEEEDAPEQTRPLPVVKIHNIRSSLPEPEIEMIYTVSEEDELVPAKAAVETLDTIDDSDVSSVLGFPIITKAEPYLARAEALKAGNKAVAAAQTNWLIGAVVVSSLLAVVILLALLLLLYRYKTEETKHKRLLASPGPSSQDNQSHNQEGSISPGASLDRADFALATSGGSYKQNLLLSNEKAAMIGRDNERPASRISMEGPKSKSDARYSSGEELFRTSKGKLDINGLNQTSRSPSNLGEESPSLADLSSNNPSPEVASRSKKAVRKTSKDHHQRSAKSRRSPSVHARKTSSSELSCGVDQSVFPVRTPDKEGFLGPLADLLEEEITLPGESRQTSAEKGKNWAYLPKHKRTHSSTSTSGSSETSLDEASPRSGTTRTSTGKGTWEEQVSEALHKDRSSKSPSPNKESIPEATASPADQKESEGSGDSYKKRAVSAKSHIFRKGKIEAANPANARAVHSRPWSAHESRLQADPIFHMRQRHWEGLISGKKRLHRGQLLPGSTSEEELKDQLQGKGRRKQQPQTCWSECTSPRKQVRISEPAVTSEILPSSSSDQGGKISPGPAGAEAAAAGPDPTGPIIQAIRDELQKFQRPKSPNLTGISIINDPELLKKDSEA